MEATDGLSFTLKMMDLDPTEREEIIKLIDLAHTEGGYLHIEVRVPNTLAELRVKEIH